MQRPSTFIWNISLRVNRRSKESLQSQMFLNFRCSESSLNEDGRIHQLSSDNLESVKLTQVRKVHYDSSSFSSISSFKGTGC